MVQDLVTRPATVAFLREQVDVDFPLTRILARLCGDGSCLLTMASGATADGQAQLVRVGPVLAGHQIGVPVEVRLGPLWNRGGTLAVPIRWEAAAFESLFPVLDGTLLFRGLGPDRTRLGIEASYRPPFEAVGGLLDRALFHRVAESTVRSFVGRMAGSLATVSGPPSPCTAVGAATA